MVWLVWVVRVSVVRVISVVRVDKKDKVNVFRVGLVSVRVRVTSSEIQKWQSAAPDGYPYRGYFSEFPTQFQSLSSCSLVCLVWLYLNTDQVSTPRHTQWVRSTSVVARFFV